MHPSEKAGKNRAAVGEREDELGEASGAVAAWLGRWASTGPKGPDLGPDGMASTAAVAAPSSPTGGADGRRGSPEAVVVMAAGSSGRGAPDLAPLPGCGVAAAASPQASPSGSVEGEEALVVEASSMAPGVEGLGGGCGVRSTRGAAPHPTRLGAPVGPDVRGGGEEGETRR